MPELSQCCTSKSPLPSIGLSMAADERVDPKSVPPRPRMHSRSEEVARAKLLAELRKLTHDERLSLLEESGIDRANDILSHHHVIHNVLLPAVKAGEERDVEMARGFAGLQAHLVRQDTTWSSKDWKTLLAGTAVLVTALGAAVAAIVAAGHH